MVGLRKSERERERERERITLRNIKLKLKVVRTTYVFHPQKVIHYTMQYVIKIKY